VRNQQSNHDIANNTCAEFIAHHPPDHELTDTISVAGTAKSPE
jgi:hypothetical protein